jgi:hypothetical protein
MDSTCCACSRKKYSDGNEPGVQAEGGSVLSIWFVLLLNPENHNQINETDQIDQMNKIDLQPEPLQPIYAGHYAPRHERRTVWKIRLSTFRGSARRSFLTCGRKFRPQNLPRRALRLTSSPKNACICSLPYCEASKP